MAKINTLTPEQSAAMPAFARRWIEIGTPEGLIPASIGKTAAGEWIISHSESGNHHVIDGGCDVLERSNAPAGMAILYAIVNEPTSLRQDAGGNAHGSHDLAPGIYEMRIKRERQAFTEQVRRVAD